jgi:hypothetical protein
VASQDQEQVNSARRYAVELDQAEVEHYRTMAEATRQAEADLWEPAGIALDCRASRPVCTTSLGAILVASTPGL